MIEASSIGRSLLQVMCSRKATEEETREERHGSTTLPVKVQKTARLASQMSCGQP